MTPEAKLTLESVGLTRFELLEIAWVDLVDDLMITEEELTQLIIRYKVEIKSYIEQRTWSEPRRMVNRWVKENRIRLYKLGLRAIVDRKTRLKCEFYDRKQLVVLVSIYKMYINWKLPEAEPVELATASEKLKLAGYKAKTSGKIQVAKPPSSLNYRVAKKARFAAIEAKKLEEERLRQEEARLKEELDRNASMALLTVS